MSAIVGAWLAAPAGAVVLQSGASGGDHIALGNGLAYSSVGQIYAARSGGASFGSGVLVARDWVLTAAHVTSNASAMSFFLDQGGTNGGRPGGIAATEWFTNPGWTGSLGAGYDLALVHLSAEAPCLAAGTCQVATVYTGAAELGNLATMVGYGTTGTGATGGTSFDGLKRAGQNVVDGTYWGSAVPGSILLADFDSGSASDNQLGSAAPVALETMAAPGDSGGGLFANIGGTEYLIGITSFVAGFLDGNPNADYGDANGWTRVSSFADWIYGVTPGTSPVDTLVAAVVTVPAPAGLSLFGFALAGMGALRRRRAGG